MIRPATIFLCAATAILFSACETPEESKPKTHHTESHQFGYKPDGTQYGDNGNNPNTAPEAPDSAPSEPVAPAPPPPTHTEEHKPAGGDGGPAPKKDYPYATPVPGKTGFVTSPYAPYSGYVDVRGFPPGTEVKDPYTQKVFLVP